MDGDFRELAGTASHASVGISRIGPYHLGKVLGRGVSGIIYEAVHIEQGRKVAVKLMDRKNKGLGPISRQDALFGREAMILAKIPKHPGLLGVLDAGISNNLPYLVTEFVDAQPLSGRLRVGLSDLHGLVRIVRDAALAVHHAHENGILHRNLKPSNILVDPAGHAWVTDFGAAKKVEPDGGQSSHLFSGQVVGTPSYMSPEQAAGLKTVDRRSDVYSLGAILYEILTGRPPFVLGSSVSDLLAIIRGNVVLPSEASSEWAASTADKSIETICMKALSKLADGRHADAKALADALSAWLGEAPAAAPAPRRSFWRMGFFVLAGLASAVAACILKF